MLKYINLFILLMFSPITLWAQVTEKSSIQLYNDFKYFPNIVLGKQANDDKKLIPAKIANEFFPYSEEEKDTKIYAVAKIVDYKGLDLFICDYEYERPDEDSYDNHGNRQQYLLLFKNEKPLVTKDNAQKQLIYTLNSHYYGEGGESEYRSYFDKDTCIVTYQYSSERESATGYATPIISTKEFRSRLDESGDLKITEVMRLEFSSPFYDKEYLKKNNASWKKAESDGYGNAFPTKDNKWKL